MAATVSNSIGITGGYTLLAKFDENVSYSGSGYSLNKTIAKSDIPNFDSYGERWVNVGFASAASGTNPDTLNFSTNPLRYTETPFGYMGMGNYKSYLPSAVSEEGSNVRVTGSYSGGSGGGRGYWRITFYGR